MGQTPLSTSLHITPDVSLQIEYQHKCHYRQIMVTNAITYYNLYIALIKNN
jgi:hypothetical protein